MNIQFTKVSTVVLNKSILFILIKSKNYKKGNITGRLVAFNKILAFHL